MKRILLISIAVLAMTAAGTAAYMAVEGRSEAEAHTPVHCNISYNSVTPPIGTATCNGLVHVQFPGGGSTHIPFELVVTFKDNPPAGPSFGDEILSCTVAINGNPPQEVHRGPCP